VLQNIRLEILCKPWDIKLYIYIYIFIYIYFPRSSDYLISEKKMEGKMLIRVPQGCEGAYKLMTQIRISDPED
jgi:hypothetical protein